MTGFHSVIERPEPVSRVAPPTTTMQNTISATQTSQSATGRERPSFRNEVMNRTRLPPALYAGGSARGMVGATGFEPATP